MRRLLYIPLIALVIAVSACGEDVQKVDATHFVITDADGSVDLQHALEACTSAGMLFQKWERFSDEAAVVTCAPGSD